MSDNTDLYSIDSVRKLPGDDHTSLMRQAKNIPF